MCTFNIRFRLTLQGKTWSKPTWLSAKRLWSDIDRFVKGDSNIYWTRHYLNPRDNSRRTKTKTICLEVCASMKDTSLGRYADTLDPRLEQTIATCQIAPKFTFREGAWLSCIVLGRRIIRAKSTWTVKVRNKTWDNRACACRWDISCMNMHKIQLNCISTWRTQHPSKGPVFVSQV
jgi:hypothetical protein